MVPQEGGSCGDECTVVEEIEAALKPSDVWGR